MTNTEKACAMLGWQGGTIHQVAETTGLSVEQIIEAKNIELLMCAQKAIQNQMYLDKICINCGSPISLPHVPYTIDQITYGVCNKTCRDLLDKKLGRI